MDQLNIVDSIFRFGGKSLNSLSFPQCLSGYLRQTFVNPMDCSLPASSIHGNSPGKNTGVGCHALPQGFFPTQASNPGLPHCKQILYYLSPQGSLRILEWVAHRFSRGPSWPRNGTGVSCIAGGFFTSWASREAPVVKKKKKKNLPGIPCDMGDTGSIPGWGRSPGEGNGNPLQYSCLKIPMDRGVCWATVHGVTNCWTQLSMHALIL